MSHNPSQLSWLLVVLIMTIITSCHTTFYAHNKIHLDEKNLEGEIAKKYENCGLEEIISYDIFKMAMIGYKNIEPKNKDIITIIDFSVPSTEKRFYLIDLKSEKLLINTWVAHGKNSGENEALNFSNIKDTKMSSPGFFVTAETYEGSNGYSLRIDGIEKHINNKARRRYIVIHGADYVNEEFIIENKRLGRSWGCPAVPMELSTQIIDLIKEGSCIFVYTNDIEYFKNSKLIEK
ncbi:MAG: murein L,D-transpeptidase catalytic domain family protein [Bacteroidales bacterium]|nr:murein L,D-transpeptidase catalytic domain family protein [Bacteroidales bacterium]